MSAPNAAVVRTYSVRGRPPTPDERLVVRVADPR
jgi:hypothetical protein